MAANVMNSKKWRRKVDMRIANRELADVLKVYDKKETHDNEFGVKERGIGI